MLIVADRNIPDAERVFEPLGTVRSVEGRTITRNDLRDADALVVRSVTRVTRELVADTPVRFVGTATIGVDHLDIPALESLGIAWTSAPGSNARSVMEYVTAALLVLRARGMTSLRGERLGVIGAGAVGSLVIEAGRAMGMDVVMYDPPRERRDPSFRSASLEEVLDVDILTLHVPLTIDGHDATHHLVDAQFLSRLRRDAILINTSRGGVVESNALIDALDGQHLRAAVLDVWEGEPDIPIELIERAAIATPHIAGYAYDAKVRAAWMLARTMGAHFDVAISSEPDLVGTTTLVLEPADDPLDTVAATVHTAYNIVHDDTDVRLLLATDAHERRIGFDLLRRDYRQRREFGAWSVEGADAAAASILRSLGFTVE